MKFIDMHCDTPSFILDNRENSLKKSNGTVDIEKLKTGNAMIQFFAYFVELNKEIDSFEKFDEMYHNFQNQIKLNEQDIEVIKRFEDIKAIEDKGKIGCLYTIEEGEVLKGDMENLYKVYDKGIRGITLTWNFENSIGYPNCIKECSSKGLKNFGFELIGEMNNLGIIVDVSHLSDGGFYDVSRESIKPFVATHSNARAITNHSRNLTDDMIKILSEKGGVMGLNFCAPFLGGSKISRIQDMILHLKHIKNVGGVDVIALGSDFDGIDNKVEIKNASKMPILAEELLKNGFKEEEIEKIFYKNALRVLKDVLA